MVVSISQPYAGFSDRLNKLLSEVGYPPLEYGRARALAEDFGVSKSGARKWLREDTPPRLLKLRVLVETIAKKGNRQSLKNTEKTIAWLQYGDVIESESDDSLLHHADHILLSKIYLSVHESAKQTKIELQSLPRKTLDNLYNTIIEQTLKLDLNEPDEKLVKSLLMLVKPS